MPKPDYIIGGVADINDEMLQGIKAVIFDIDDTVSPHGLLEPSDEAREKIEQIKSRNIRVGYISNNPLVRSDYFKPTLTKAKKPSPKGFLELSQMLGARPSETLVVGDQLFTDVLGGKRAGMKTAAVKPITNYKDPIIAVKRVFEKPLLKIYGRKKK